MEKIISASLELENLKQYAEKYILCHDNPEYVTISVLLGNLIAYTSYGKDDFEYFYKPYLDTIECLSRIIPDDHFICFIHRNVHSIFQNIYPKQVGTSIKGSNQFVNSLKRLAKI